MPDGKMIKSHRIALTPLILMALMCAQILIPVYAASESRPGRTPEPPEGSEKVVVDMATPHQYTHNFTLGVPQVLQFREMTIQFNASRNMVFNVTSEEGLRIRYLAIDVDANEPVRLNIRVMSTPGPNARIASDGLGEYLSIEPNATAQIRTTLRLYIDPEAYVEELGRNLWLERLRWAHWNGTDWVPVESWMDKEVFLVAKANRTATWTVREMRGLEAPPAGIPGVPARTRAYNYTDLNPNMFRWTAREREGTLFLFRNTAMLFNSTKMLRLNITAGDDVANRLFKLQLKPAEALELQVRMQVQPPSGVPVAKGLGVYLAIEHNATAPFTAMLGMLIDNEEIQARLGRTVDPERLRWAYWNGSKWVEVESSLTKEGILEAETSHFSTWTIVEAEAPVQGRSGTEQPAVEPAGIPQIYFAAAGFLLLALVVVFITLKRRP